MPVGIGCCLSSIGYTDLIENVTDMADYGVGADYQLIRYLAVAFPLSD
jgi:hypothetical protein